MARVLLISGKGGVGKTTVAAATGARAAARGTRTLVVSLDRAHNLGDVLGMPLGPEPAPVRGIPHLHAMELNPQRELARQWKVLSRYLGRLLEWAGVGGVEAGEVAVLPGLEELLTLARLTELAESKTHELVVVDLAPTASSLRLLSFPDLMAGPLGQLARWERSFLKLTRPAVSRLTRAPVPDDALYEALDVLVARIGRLRALLSDPTRAVVRLVAIPERVVIDETRSAFTLLSLFGLTTDTVVLNRVLPEEAARGYLKNWTRIQARERDRAREAFPAVALRELSFQPDEPLGAAAVARVGRELYGRSDPAAFSAAGPPLSFGEEAGGTVLTVRLPHAEGEALDLKERDDALILTLGGWRRQLALPESLRGRPVRSAAFSGGALRIVFAPPQEESR